LLGRKDEPTDAVEQYCRYLGDALEAHHLQLEIRRVPWELHGWREAHQVLELEAAAWRETWVLLQYTALAWSSRGFPQRVLRTLKILKSAGARIGIVYHDVEPYHGSRFIDRLRRTTQLRTMRTAISLAELAIFTIPLEKVSWLPRAASHARFIPVGPNLPIPSTDYAVHDTPRLPTIGIFSITGGVAGARETRTILTSVRHAAERIGKLRLLVFGRHAELREAELRQGLGDLPVELSVEGVLQPDQVVQRLSACHVMLFVRGPISSRRSSALAGIACGLPVIAYSGPETAPPITEAGVILVPSDQPDKLNSSVIRVLSDDVFREQLAAQSRAAYRSYFAWPTIAARFAKILNK
jgi:glycosyltransferase involved in cell wall biosynthesis